jgi:hypothetical protein
MQHANKILGKLQVPTNFCSIMKTPHSPSYECDNLDTTQMTPPIISNGNPCQNSSNLTECYGRQMMTYSQADGRRHCTAKMPPKELVLSALMNKKSIPQWQSKSPVMGQLSALMVNKSTALWQTKSPASGQSSALMNQKTTPQCQPKSPSLGQPSALMVNKSTALWQTKSPALGQPSGLMDNTTTTKWQTKSPAPVQPSALMTHKSTPEWQPTTPTPKTAQPALIAPIPSPEWTHPMPLLSAHDEIWLTNLLDIIRAIKKAPPGNQPNPNILL